MPPFWIGASGNDPGLRLPIRFLILCACSGSGLSENTDRELLRYLLRPFSSRIRLSSTTCGATWRREPLRAFLRRFRYRLVLGSFFCSRLPVSSSPPAPAASPPGPPLPLKLFSLLALFESTLC